MYPKSIPYSDTYFISQEEYESIEIGDYVRIVSEWNEASNESPHGGMDRYLSSIIQVVNKSRFGVHTHDVPYMFNRYCINQVIKADDALLNAQLEDCDLKVTFMML